MEKGVVVSIHITPTKGEPVVAVGQVRAVPGQGLEGDRYFRQAQTGPLGPDRELTLIEIEAIQAFEAAYGVKLEPGATRRNVVTRGIALNTLVGQTFRVGAVRLRGMRLCEPCEYLAQVTSPHILPGLAHRGGLRAQIITEGLIQVEDSIDGLA